MEPARSLVAMGHPVAAVILAAGGGTRFAGPTHKLLAPLQGKPVIEWVFDAVEEAAFHRVYVVTGSVDLGLHLPPSFIEVHAEDWADGQSRTLQAAVTQAGADDQEAIVVGLGDQPMVPASAWRSVGAASGQVVAATFGGERRPPVKLHRSIWDLLPTEGDAGARNLLRDRPDLVSEIPCTGNPTDIDTIEDLQRWN